VRDLVDELRELGPRFRVVVLDASKKAYRSTLRDETIVQRGKARDLAKQLKDLGPGFDVYVFDTRKKDYRPLHEEERVLLRDFPEFAASTAGLLSGPLGQGPLLAATELLPGGDEEGAIMD